MRSGDRGGPGRARSGERGFTLIEVLIAMALISIGTAFISVLFIQSYRLWAKNYYELILQQNTRVAMETITKALRRASPATVQITTTAGNPTFSAISFKDVVSQRWNFQQSGTRILGYIPLSGTITGSATTTVATDVDALSFVYPNFTDNAEIDVGITSRRVPYGGSDPIIIQMVERVDMRNP